MLPFPPATETSIVLAPSYYAACASENIINTVFARLPWAVLVHLNSSESIMSSSKTQRERLIEHSMLATDLVGR